MTKEAKSIIKKDIKKYTLLAEYTTEEENRKVFQKIVNDLEEKINK